MQNEIVKKKRGSNFTGTERQLLIKITNKYKSIIENKKTDGTTWREKDKTWTRIEEEFNAIVNGQPRSAKQLKFKYESIKKELKKEHSSQQKYLRGTGGGRHIPSPKPKTEEEKILLDTIAVTVSGYQSQFDSDAMAGIEGIPVGNEVEVEMIESQDVEVDWSYPSAGFLQTKKNPVLKGINTSSFSEINIISDDKNNYQNETENENKNYCDHEYNKKIEVKKSNETSGKSDITPKNDWSSRRRPVLKKRKCMSSASAKFEELAMKKKQLVDQIILDKEKQNQREEIEHNLKVKNLKLENQILVLKRQVMQKKLLE